MLAGSDKSHHGARQRFPHAVHFARFGARIEASVQKHRWHPEPAEPPIIKILIGPLNSVGDSKPGPAIAAQHRWPDRFSEILSSQPARSPPQFLGMRREAFEKGSGPGSSPHEVKRLQ